MGISNRSHGKKSDKETQSPVLKLFRDIMQKEKRNPEKTNLLKSKTAEKKRKKYYPGSRSKSDHKTVESSCSERHDTPYKGKQELRTAECDPSRTRSFPFQGEKKESWWFWGEPNAEKPASEDTCSCVSCALKKIINTDYACIGCLVLLFTISVIVAFLLVYKSIPCLNDKPGSGKMESDRPKRKIDGLSRLRWNQLGMDTIGARKWDEGGSRYGVPQSMDVETNFQDLTSLVDSDSDLFKILDSDVIEELQSSDRLREFYKKLIQTDAQIRNLKKNNDHSLTRMDNIEDQYKTFPDRAKRSLKILHKPLKLFHLRKNKKDKKKEKVKIKDEKNRVDNENNKTMEATKVAIKDNELKNHNDSRNKRFDDTTEPKGFLIEKKKVLIQYKPKHIHRKSKCSHAPKESKSHENQLKHPFYQNTQRLDELLDKFLDKNLPEILTDPFGLDIMFEKEKKCKHPKVEVETEEKNPTEKSFIENKQAITKTKEEFKNNNVFNKKDNDFKNNFNKGDFRNSNAYKTNDIDFNKDKFKNNNAFKNIDYEFTKILKTETSTVQNDIFADLEFGDGDRKREDTTTTAYGLLMSVTTMMYAGNNNFKRTTYPALIDAVPNARKLLQTDADDDMNEVMVDSAHDETDKEERKKRMDESPLEVMNNKLKMNPASILNPNWKGPMPLYPDELNSMIKQEPIIVNTAETPVHSKYNSETHEELIANKAESDNLRKDASESNESLDNIESPINSRDSPSEVDEFETDLNDMEYIEDYFRNKYDRLVEMAQAYSDYGVLEGKKTTDKKVDDKVKLEGPDHRIKLALSGFKEGFKNSIFRRPKKGSPEAGIPSEGFRLEIQPTSASREDNPLEIYKTVQKHIKVSNFKQKPNPPSDLSGVEMNLIYTPRSDDTKTSKDFGLRENEFSVGKVKRSLKSIEITDNDTLSDVLDENKDGAISSKQNFTNVIDSTNLKLKRDVGNSILSEDNNTTSNAMKLAAGNEFAKNSSKNDANEAENNTNLARGDVLSSNTDMNLSEFFMLLSNWFSALDGVDVNANHSLVENSRAPNQTKSKELNNNKTVEMIYPVYDSDMIENIGHRSRVLLSVEDVNVTAKYEHKGDKEAMAEVNENTDLKSTNATNNLTPKTNIKENKTKSIVKRNTDENNLIFWNDLYDDEYGVQDHFQNNIRDKHSVGGNEFIKRPKEWFREKVRNIADGFHKRAEGLRMKHKGGDTVKSETEKHDKEDKIKNKPKDAIYKRNSRNVEDNVAKKTDFAALTANMKKICRKAARDIAQTNKVDVRAVSKEGQVASTLMQQLVRLMGDLVDYQVKQRTCRRLPKDLQNFLEWLTSSNPEPDSAKYSSGYKTEEYPDIDFGKMNDKSELDHTLDVSSSERPDSRSECLSTLQSVQALMRQYEELADDDKSKMTGVKEYLETQIQYLQKQMSSNNDFSLYNLDSLRLRREVTSETPTSKHYHKKKRRRIKQIINNFMKKLARKHYNADANNKTIINNKINNNDASIKEVKKLNNNERTNAGNYRTFKEKRNLRDVYYKAVEDARKLTTVKKHGK